MQNKRINLSNFQSQCTRIKYLPIICFISFQGLSAQSISKFKSTKTEQETFQNPIIHADYSDPDAIRVGDEYYMISSSFNFITKPHVYTWAPNSS